MRQLAKAHLITIDDFGLVPLPDAIRPDLLEILDDRYDRVSGIVCGRRMYEVMSYWYEDRADWDAEERDCAAAWRSQPKWVVSRSLKSVRPNATLIENDIEAVIRGLKAQLVGEIEVAGPDLAASLTDLGLIDEYRLYLRPFVLGRGKPFFAGRGRRSALSPAISLARTRLD